MLKPKEKKHDRLERSFYIDCSGSTANIGYGVCFGFFFACFGFSAGYIVVRQRSGIRPRPVLYQIVSRVINVLRSFPFIILMILLFPLSRLLIGTSIGTAASIVPLSIAAAPFAARIAENSFKEVDEGVVQAARAMGSTDFQIIVKVLLPEALPSLTSGITLTIINLIGYSAMAGAVGGGGLGDLAIRYGYQRFRADVMVCSVALIILFVELIQTLGSALSSAQIKRR